MGMRFSEENLLDHLQQPEFASLRSSLVKRLFPKDGFVCQPGQEENMIFLVASGRVRVYLGYEEKEFNLGILSQGDIYSTHSGTYVQAITDTEILFTDLHTIRREMLAHPEITMTMVRILGNMLKSSFAIIDGLAFRDVNHRLVALLASEARKQDRRADDGSLHLVLDLTVEQIARLVGSSRQTVSTLLNDLFRAGLLKRLDRAQFVIPDITALEAIGGVNNSFSQ